MPTFQIKHCDGHVIREDEAESLGKLVQDSVLREVDLSGADLRYADLRHLHLQHARLVGANLTYARLDGSDLQSASLAGADLRQADSGMAFFHDADLSGANLRETSICQCYEALFDGALLRFSCHPVMAEILRQAAGRNVGKLKAAGLIAMTPTRCWPDYFDTRNKRLIEWAVGVFEPFVDVTLTKGLSVPTSLYNAILSLRERRQPADSLPV